MRGLRVRVRNENVDDPEGQHGADLLVFQAGPEEFGL